MVTVSLVFKQIFFCVLPAIGKANNIKLLTTNVPVQKDIAIYGILFVCLWQGPALPTMLLMAGLQTIPEELCEAAAIDGASAWQRFGYITLIYLIPTLSTIPVLKVKQGLTDLDYIKMLTDGAPGTTTQSIAILICNNCFVSSCKRRSDQWRSQRINSIC